MIGVGAALGLILVGVVGLTIFRNAYSRGLVLEHLPDDCDELYYADLAGIVASDPIEPQLERFLKNSKDLADDELGQKSKKEKERFERALEALRKNGVEPTTVREVAFCVPHVDKEDGEKAEDKLLLVVGGTFRRGDVLRGIQEAAQTVLKDEDACKLEDDDGFRMLKCTPELKGKSEPVYASLVESRVLAVSPDKKMVKRVRSAKDRSKLYGANKGEHLVRYRAKEAPTYDGSFGETKLRIGGSDTVLTIDVHYDPDKGKKKLEQLKDADEVVKKKEKALASASDKCFGSKNPLEPLADAVDRTKVEAFDDGIRYESKISHKDLAKAFKNLADADRDDLGKLWKTWFCVYDAVEPYTSSYKYSD